MKEETIAEICEGGDEGVKVGEGWGRNGDAMRCDARERFTG